MGCVAHRILKSVWGYVGAMFGRSDFWITRLNGAVTISQLTDRGESAGKEMSPAAGTRNGWATRIGCSHRLLNELRLNNANVRGATSVRRNQWSAAEIYPNRSRAPHSPWTVSKRTRSPPSLDPRRSRDGNTTIPRSGRCIGTQHAPDQHGGRRRRVRGPATDLRRRADPIVLDLLVLQRHPARARGRFPGVWMVRLRAVQVGLWWR
jgi:hypothetical protein